MRTKPLPPADQCQQSGLDPTNGWYLIPRKREKIKVVVSDGRDWELIGWQPPAWEHVSVSLEHRCPTWEEMAWVKSLFWKDDECVIQFHVPTQDHINYHPNVLHMWRPIGIVLPMPPSDAVAPKGAKY